MYNIDIQSPEFVKCLERGEREAFQRLFEMYHKALCFFATRIVRDSLEAEDIVQDVFLAFWRMDRGGFPNLKTVKTFLYNSVQHRCELSPGFGDSGPELSKSETGRVG